ncbi:MAG: cysteine--tRNA ligase [Nitrososphaerota archaeon]|nr:cysteine--tRNA ligase [Candidatus Bathyarchaeota archaeon]MCX8162509.1 cysteine--tRNA ligase [Candidatus Bathyarchaeota archaeon]MDW8061392.1 cysteine--tRNA ligase [Nitrososphaerota archaeon]
MYSSLSRVKEVFEPIHDGWVGIYVCGPTVYDWTHLGHARTYIAFDAIVRWLEYRGYRVFYVQNITDVGHLTEAGEDKVVGRAIREKVEPMALVEFYMREYFRDMDVLGVRRPDVSPRATGHIIDMIEVIKRLIEKGYAYEVDGNVFFDVSRFPDYGKLSRVKLEDMIAGARIDVHPGKRDPRDFALWKKAGEDYPLKWVSPWGYGFPGWHIECTVMAMRYLGEQIDIHGGALDLIFPHHENEIAQAEAFTGRKPFVKYWMHTGLLTVNGEKMAKSLGNYVRIRDVLDKFSPAAVRLFILSTHYRSQLDYREEKLVEAEANVKRLMNSLTRLEEAKVERASDKPASSEERRILEELYRLSSVFDESMDDDFNTAEAVSFLFEICRAVNKLVDLPSINRAILSEAETIFKGKLRVLGLPDTPSRREVSSKLVEALIDIIIDVRNEARKRKDYATADEIRRRLASIGVKLEDLPGKTIWRIEEAI